MGNNDLRNPIVKTVALIAAITLIILFSFNAPPGSGILGTLAAILSGIFTTIKIIIGLLAAFAISLFLFVVIFSLSVAIISRADALKVINSVVHRLTGKEVFSRSRVHAPQEPGVTAQKEEKVQEQETIRQEAEGGVDDRVKDYMDRYVTPLQNAKEKLADEVSALRSRLKELGEEVRASRQDRRVEELEDSVGMLRSDLDSLQQGVAEIRKEVGNVKQQLLDTASAPRKEQGEAAGTGEKREPEAEHRIFEYLSRKTDRRKLAELTEKTVEQGMSYAEATNFITSNMPGEAASIVEAHPALTKEYIKSCRDEAAKS